LLFFFTLPVNAFEIPPVLFFLLFTTLFKPTFMALVTGFVAVFAGGMALIVGSGGIEAAVAFEPLAGSKYNK
jgi:hypothetical protein